MISSVDLRELQSLGLTERESKVYLALVNQGAILPLEIQSITSIQRSKIYEALHNLMQMGFVVERPVGKKKLYEAIRPDEVIQNLLLRRKREMDELQQIGDQLEHRLIGHFESSFRGQSAQDYFTFLQNPTLIERRWTDLHARAETEIITCVKAPYIYANEDDDPQLVNKPVLDALGRGVKYRAIYEADEIRALGNRHETFLKPRQQAGEEGRVYDGLSIKLTVFDRRVSYFGFIDEALPRRITAILIENRGIANAFAASFEFYWAASTPLEQFIRQIPKS